MWGAAHAVLCRVIEMGVDMRRLSLGALVLVEKVGG